MYAELALATELAYFELINTTALDHIKAKYGAEKIPGGLAGADPEYQDMAEFAVRYMYEAVGAKTDVMGMGGVNSAERAMKLIRAGASGIGINTGIRQLGLRAVNIIELGLSDMMDEFPAGTRLENVVGLDTRRGAKIPRAA